MSGEAPSVSVVIPTLRRPQLLRAAVESVLEQDYDGAIECLVVYDGELADPPQPPTRPARTLTVLRNERRKGAAGARNTGFLRAGGALLALCDDDDTWLPGKVQAQVAALAAEPAAIGVGAGYYIERHGRVTARRPRQRTLTREALLRSRAADVHPSTLVFHRERLLETVGLLDEDVPGSYGEDYDWLLRATASGPIMTLDQPLARVQWHAGSYFTGQWETIIKAIEYLTAKHSDFQSQPRGQARLFGRLAFAHAALGRREQACEWAVRAMRLNPRERRAYLALVVATGLVKPSLVTRLASRTGRGI
jgi:GT2 family glycosyltransferase